MVVALAGDPRELAPLIVDAHQSHHGVLARGAGLVEAIDVIGFEQAMLGVELLFQQREQGGFVPQQSIQLRATGRGVHVNYFCALSSAGAARPSSRSMLSRRSATRCGSIL